MNMFLSPSLCDLKLDCCRNGRVETVLMFAQAVYLMFSSVYVCKETVEHLLLSSGGGDGHHHHHGDEEVGLGYVRPFLIISFIDEVSENSQH